MARKRRGGLRARAPPKSQERALVQRAKALRDDFSPLLPKCASDCNPSVFRKIERALSVVQKFSDDQKRLEKLASRGDLIARGYAGMLMIANAGKVPYTAAAPTPFGEAIYAVRGKVPKEVLIGVQHYDDKRLLLLAYMSMAMKKGLYFYATKDALYCTGRTPNPPEDYIKEALGRIPYKLRRDGKSLMCHHLRDGESRPYLSIRWKSAGIEIMVCESCLSDGANTFALLTEGIGAKNPMADFDIELSIDLEIESDGNNCPKIEKKGMKKLMERYVHGRLSDKGFMESALKSMGYSGDGRYLIIGRKCYGEDEKAFIDALKPGKYRKVVEEFVKSRDGPIIIENPSVNKVLDYAWDRWGKRALHEIFKSRERAEIVWEDRKKSGRTPLEIIDEGLLMMEAEKKLERLPHYGNLPKTADFCDTVARAYKISGKDEALKVIGSWKNADEHIKAISYAFLSAMELEKGKEWQYNRIERELGASLKDRAKALLESEGDDYHNALLELLRYAGVNEKVVK